MDSSKGSQATEQIAADWLAKRDGETWTAADEAAFAAWQRESTAHRVAVIRLKTIWQHADRLKALGAGVPPGSIPPPGQWRTSPFIDSGRGKHSIAPDTASFPAPATQRLKIAAIAAAVVLTLTSGMAWYFLAHEPNTYRTAVGQSQAVHLADGSQITLNTDSKVHVALSESERRVELDRGEVFFNVARDPARPFVVAAGGKRVVAVGTKFSVLRTQDELRVVVTEGKVRVEAAARENAESPVQLGAGNIARVGGAGVLVTANSIPEAEQTLSWRSGYIVLRDTALADAVAEFNRYNKRRLVIADPELATLRVGGNLRLSNLEAFVRVLEQGFPIQAESEEDRIVLTRR